MFAGTLRIILQVLSCCAVGTAMALGQASTDVGGGPDHSISLTNLATQEAAPDGLAAEDWASIRAAYEESRHAAYAAEGGGYHARNPGQQWNASFDGRGFSVLPDAGGWIWGLELERYGFAGSEQEVTGLARTSAEGGRVSYEWNETLEEWFVNDARGLEHGYTVTERPKANGQRSADPLTFTLAVRGPLRPEVDADGRGVRFRDESGAIAVTYTGLCVVDADGRELEASFERIGEELLLSVDERDAFYPLTIDPIVQQQAYLKGHDTGQGDTFGFSVSVSGDTVVVAAVGEDSNATGVNGDQNNGLAPNSGAAYVFVRIGTSWSQQASLKASNTDASDSFGTSVSVSDDTVVVGAPYEDSSATSVDGNQSDNSSPSSGAAYVFVRNGTSWNQQAYLKARNSGMGDRFGISVAVSGNTVVVGAGNEDSDATGVNGNGSNNGARNAGAAYVFIRSGTTWSQQAYLKASNSDADDWFGLTLSVSGDTVVVGSSGEDSNATGVNGNQSDNSASNSGAAYVFVRSGTGWSQQAYLKASNAEAGDFFGGVLVPYYYYPHVTVAVSGDTIVIGAPLESSTATGVNGDQNNNGARWSGAAYVFVRNGTIWSQEAYLKASNTDVNNDDWFGFSVSASSDTVVVGAIREQSNATGVNGDQNNNNFIQAGAAYLFIRSDTTWSQQAYLKASNTDFGDEFSYSVSVSGNTLLVGAPGERSSATGVNGKQTDNSAFSAGAAYVFEISSPVTYCTGKTTSAGCVPFMSWSGVPSPASGSFELVSQNHVEGNPAVLLYSFQKAQLGFHGGTLCVRSPFRRLSSLINATDGLACSGCTGNCRMFKRDFNQLIQAGTDPMLTPGQDVHVQVRQSDPANLGPTGFADNLSDAIAFTIGL